MHNVGPGMWQKKKKKKKKKKLIRGEGSPTKKEPGTIF